MARLRLTPGGSEEAAVDSLRIVDSNGDVHYVRDYDFEMGESGFEEWFEVSVSRLETSKGSALMLDEYVFPSAPSTGQSRQFFALTDHRLQPVTPLVSGYGEFVDLPQGHQPGSFRLLPGDRMLFRAWMVSFAVEVPLDVRLPPFSANEPEAIAPAVDFDTESGLAILPVVNPVVDRPEYREETRQVTLYHSLVGPQAEPLLVRRTSSIEYGPAYGRVRLSRAPGAADVTITVDISRLRVTIDGKTGFVEEEDFRGVGLGMAG